MLFRYDKHACLTYFMRAFMSPGWEAAWQATPAQAVDGGGSGLPSGYEQHLGKGKTLVCERTMVAVCAAFRRPLVFLTRKVFPLVLRRMTTRGLF